MIKTQKLFAVFLLTLTALMPVAALAQVDAGFDPGKLIDDNVFSDIETFGGPEGVQKFLEIKGSVLANTSPDFLVKLKEPSNVELKTGLEDPRPNLGRLRTAAELIWDASRQSGLNPQVILVTLNKEQSLVTGHQTSSPEKLQRALDFAMGFDCPDSSGCSTSMLPGFYFQLFGNFDSEGNRYLGATKSLMKSFNTDGGRGPAIDQQGFVQGTTGAVRTAKVGDVLVFNNDTSSPFAPPPQSIVTLANRATTALYRYTPHIFNGNYNFWRFFNEWFKYPSGTILKLTNGSETYIIQNGSKLLIPAFVAAARGLNVSSAITVSPTEFSNIPTGEMLGPSDNTIVKVDGAGQAYVFINNIKHPASEFVIKQRGLNPAQILAVTAQEAGLFKDGSILTPTEGTVIRGEKDPAIYLVENGMLKLFSSYTFAQRKVTAKQVMLVPDEEVATYPKQGFVAPLDGTLIKAANNGTVFIVEKGFKRPLSAELFKNRGLSFKNVATLSADEVNGLTIGAFATPKEITWLANSKTGEMYLYKEGALHQISSFVAKQRRITADYKFSPTEIQEWQIGMPYPPRDGTVIKGDKLATVYYVSKGQLRPMTAKAFKARKLTAKSITTLPQAEVDNYAKGETLEK